MQVLNIHKRKIDQPGTEIATMLHTLASKDDQVWPYELWPRMRLKEGLQEGSIGGHGPIRYQVINYDKAGMVEFKFLKPKGFIGTHKLEVHSSMENQCEIKHTVDVKTQGMATITWMIAIKWLHDALIEDAFDKIENRFRDTQKRTKWSLWVRFMRRALK